MHTSAEVLDMADAEYAAELIKHFVCSKEIADAMRRA
jgi:putative aminopeptidase FrvX